MSRTEVEAGVRERPARDRRGERKANGGGGGQRGEDRAQTKVDQGKGRKIGSCNVAGPSQTGSHLSPRTS